MTEQPIPPAWWEISLKVKEELAESVADVLARFAPGGVSIGSLAIEPDPDGEGRPSGPLAVCAYLPADAEYAAVRARLEEALWHLGQIAPLPEPVWKPVVRQDWSLEWKKHYRPIRVGRRLRIVPSWMDPAPYAGEVILRLDPGMAFGTGMHPTTQLCLEAIEARMRPGMEMIDLGCGSGILAIAAARLGAARVLGVDTDSDAVLIAGENARTNAVDRTVEFQTGSLADLLAQNRSAPLVAANILAHVLRAMLGEGLARTVAPGGSLILSGILADQSAEVEQSVREAGLRVAEKLVREDWVAVVCGRD